jgi:hypothetical protein
VSIWLVSTVPRVDLARVDAARLEDGVCHDGARRRSPLSTNPQQWIEPAQTLGARLGR